MTQRPIDLQLQDEDFVKRAADLVGRALGGDRATGNVSDLNKFLGFLELDEIKSAEIGDQSIVAKVREEQTGNYKMREDFDATIGRLAGSLGRGALGAGRNIGEKAQSLIPIDEQAIENTRRGPEGLPTIEEIYARTPDLKTIPTNEQQLYVVREWLSHLGGGGRPIPGESIDEQVANGMIRLNTLFDTSSQTGQTRQEQTLRAGANPRIFAELGLLPLQAADAPGQVGGGLAGAGLDELLGTTNVFSTIGQFAGAIPKNPAGLARGADNIVSPNVSAIPDRGLYSTIGADFADKEISEIADVLARGAKGALNVTGAGNRLAAAGDALERIGVPSPIGTADAAFDLPSDLSRSRVNYGRTPVEFDSDLDRALYIATSRRRSARRDDFIAALTKQGYDTPEKIREAAAPVRARVAEIARDSGDTIRVPAVSNDAANITENIPTSGQATLTGDVVPAATEQDIADRLTKQSAFDIDAGSRQLTPQQIAEQAAQEQARFDSAAERAGRLFDEADGTPSRSPQQIINESNDPVELTDLIDELELEINDLAERVDQAALARDRDANPVARLTGILGVSARNFPQDAVTPRQAYRLDSTGFLPPKTGTGSGGRVTKKNWTDAARRHFGDDAIDSSGNVKREYIDLAPEIVELNPTRYSQESASNIGDPVANVIADIEQARGSRGASGQLETNLRQAMELRDLAVERFGAVNSPDIADLPSGSPETRPFRRAANIPEGPIPHQTSLNVRSGMSAGGVPLDVSPTHRQAATDSLPLGRGGNQPPRQPPIPGDELPAPDQFGGRPRTLNDLVREARGMWALSPEERARVNDLYRPLSEVPYRVGGFDEAMELAAEAGSLTEAARKVPGARRIIGMVEGTRINADDPVFRLAQNRNLFVEREVSKARFASLNWWNDAQPAFGFKNGLATAVDLSPVAPVGRKSLRTIDDMLAHPEHYVLSPTQQEILQMGSDMQTAMLRDAQRAGVDTVELSEAYWHRIVDEGPAESDSGARVRAIRRQRGYQLARAFDDIEEGLESDFVYELDPLKRLVARLEAGIHTIADQEVRNRLNSFPGVQKPSERIATEVTDRVARARAIRDSKKDALLRPGGDRVAKLQELREAEADFTVARRDLMVASRRAKEPGLNEMRLPTGRIAPRELWESVNQYFLSGTSPSDTEQAFRLIRSSLTTADLAAGFIQGQTLFYRNNIAWWKAQAQSVLAIVDDPRGYVAKNYDVMQEGVEVGAIMSPTEFLYARTGLSSLPTRIPLVGPAFKAFNRAFEWFIIAAQTELYKASRSRILSDATRANMRQDLIDVGSAIRRQTGTESYAILGVTPRQQTLESWAFFAPRFFRANVGIMQQALRGGEGGREARRAMGSLIAGGTSLTIALHYASTGRMPNFTDPETSTWAKFRLGNSYISAYGPFNPFFRTMARVGVQIADGRPADALREVGNFTRAKAGIPFRFAKTAAEVAITGESRTFDGDVIDLSPEGATTLLREQLPIGPIEFATGISEGRPEAALEVVGINTSPIAESTSLLLIERANALGKNIQSLNELNTNERSELMNDPQIRGQVFENRLKRGGYTAALADIEAEEYTRTFGLMQKLFSGQYTDSKGKALSTKQAHRAFVNDFYTLRSEVRRAREQARKDFRVSFDDSKPEDDPLEFALQQYYQVIDESIDEFGNFVSSKYNAGIKELEKGWSPEQREFVEDYRDRRHYPEGATSLVDMESVSTSRIKRIYNRWRQAEVDGLIRTELIEHFRSQQ